MAFTLGACVVKKSTYQKALDELTVTGQKLDAAEADRSRQTAEIRRLEIEVAKSRRAGASFQTTQKKCAATVESLQLALSQARLKAKLLTVENAKLREPPAAAPKTTKAKQAARIRALEAELMAARRIHKLAVSKLERLLRREQARLRVLHKALDQHPKLPLK